MSSFLLTITAIDKILFQGNATLVTCPGTEGEFTVLKNHEPFIAPLAEGKIHVAAGDGQKMFPVKNGFLMTEKEETIILV